MRCRSRSGFGRRTAEPVEAGRSVPRGRLGTPAAVLGALLLGALAACREPPPPTPPPPETPPPVTEARAALRPVRWPNVPELVDDGDWTSLRQALERSRGWLARRPEDEPVVFGPLSVRAADLKRADELVLAWLDEDPPPAELARRLAERFWIFESVTDVLVTGYYEPVIEGSLRRTAEYSVPVYGPPSDVIKIALGDFREEYRGVTLVGRLRGNRVVPYPNRKELRESRELHGRAIAWARDPVDLFFVEVQGSGALRLPDGREIRIGYAGSNGRLYRSIGKKLIDDGKLEREKVSMQSIREYLRLHPDEIDEVLDHNESVVFFRRLEGPPVGSLGLTLTPGRSIATDHRLFPRGALAFLASEVPGPGPDGATVAERPLRRFVLNQDTGGAIRGTDRVDFFWGRGEEAAMRAGLMKQPGKIYFLVPQRESSSPQPPSP